MADFSAIKAAAVLNAIELVGDYGVKTDNNLLMYGGYNAMAYVLHETASTRLGLVNAYWNALSNVTVTMLGYYMGERMSSMQYAGVATIAAGIWMLGQE